MKFGWTLFSASGPNLLGSYPGSSCQHLKEKFEHAKNANLIYTTYCPVIHFAFKAIVFTNSWKILPKKRQILRFFPIFEVFLSLVCFPGVTLFTPYFRNRGRIAAMPTNIEIKARVHNPGELRRRAEKVSDTPVEVIPQEDTFFYTPKGRLKLRQLRPDFAQLVYYERPDQDGPKRSNYHIFETQDPAGLKTALSLALGVRGIVRKNRFLYMAGQTRIHLDDVESLGQFVELEVVLQDGQTDAEGQAIAEDLLFRLGIRKDDLLEGAYIDLLERGI